MSGKKGKLWPPLSICLMTATERWCFDGCSATKTHVRLFYSNGAMELDLSEPCTLGNSWESFNEMDEEWEIALGQVLRRIKTVEVSSYFWWNVSRIISKKYIVMKMFQCLLTMDLKLNSQFIQYEVPSIQATSHIFSKTNVQYTFMLLKLLLGISWILSLLNSHLIKKNELHKTTLVIFSFKST